MTLSPAEFLLILVVTALFVIATVAIHYEALLLIQRILPKLATRPRVRIGIGVVMALMAHAAEAWLFALGYWLSVETLNLGSLAGAESPTFFDYLYFSFVSYTTVGFGDLSPVGAVRFLSNMESLTGFVVITWTASFLYMEMERHWRDRQWR